MKRHSVANQTHENSKPKEKHQTQIQVGTEKTKKKNMMIYEIPFHANAQHNHTIYFTNEL